MQERVVASLDIPNYLPKMENPIYKLAVEQKERLRKEVIERIKSGTFEDGIAPLLKMLNGFRENEKNQIIDSWKVAGNTTLLFWYMESILDNDLMGILNADARYLLIISKNNEKLGR